MLLSREDVRRLGQWKYAVEDRSVSTRLLTPFWNFLVPLIPPHVAPNIISLSGLLAIVHAWFLSHLYLDTWPRSTSIVVTILLFSYQTMDALDGKHARRISNASSMGELFDHACDNVGIIFMTVTLCHILSINDMATQWHLVQITQFIFLNQHLSALKSRVVSFSPLTGPGEALWACMVIILLRAMFGMEWLWGLVTVDTLAEAVRYLYGASLLMVAVKVVSLPKKDHATTRFGFALILLHRALRAVLFAQNRGWWWGAPQDESTMLLTVFIDGLFLSVVCSDIIVAKMASKQLNTWIMIFSSITIIDNLITLIICVGYYIVLFHEISIGLHLPVFSTFRNVYVDGIFDLCHLGHRQLISRAARLGDRVFVGICSDEESTTYKRAPIMNLDERVAAVESCKDVYHVIRAVPVSGVTPEILDEYNIHVVACDEEYCNPLVPEKYKYYKAAHDRGIVVPMARTPGMSTTDLIKRILVRASDKDWAEAEKERQRLR